MFAAFMGTANITSIDISKAPILANLLALSRIPFIFSLAAAAVGRAAMAR
jgi:K(+)-stimulated pyrophosphate-energized sodium pump